MATLTITIDLAQACPGATAADFIDLAERCVQDVRKQYPNAGHTLAATNVYTQTKNNDHTQRDDGRTKISGQTKTVSLTSVAVS